MLWAVNWPDCESDTGNQSLDKIDVPQIVSRRSHMRCDLSATSQMGGVLSGMASPACSHIFSIKNILFFTLFPVYHGACGSFSSMMMTLGAGGRDLDGPGFSNSLITVYFYRKMVPYWDHLCEWCGPFYLWLWCGSTICSQTQMRGIHSLPFSCNTSYTLKYAIFLCVKSEVS